MSLSAYLRGNGQGIFYTLNYLAHLEQLGIHVINGRRAFTVETSKALQLSLMESLGLLYPRARVINHASEAPAAARTLTRQESSGQFLFPMRLSVPLR